MQVQRVRKISYMALRKSVHLLFLFMLLAACGVNERPQDQPAATLSTSAPTQPPTAAAARATPIPTLVRLVIFDEPE